MDELTPVVKGVLAVFPVGSGAVTWWNERKTQKDAEELSIFRDWVLDEITKLNNNNYKIDEKYLNSKEFENFLTRIVTSILSEYTNLKKDIYKSILINSIKGIRPTGNLKEQYLHILDITSSTEIMIMSEAYKIQKDLPAEARHILHQKGLPEGSKITIREISEKLNISSEETLNIVWSLTGRGLAFSLRNDLSFNDNFVLTPFGANFCLFITLDG